MSLHTVAIEMLLWYSKMIILMLFFVIACPITAAMLYIRAKFGLKAQGKLEIYLLLVYLCNTSKKIYEQFDP